ncbi:MAG: hypothetical protein WC634_00480 [archaeon]
MSKKILMAVLLMLLLAAPAFAGDLKANSLSYEPAPVAPSSAITIWVQIKNDSGYDAEDSIIRMEVEFPFSLQPGEEAEKSLGLIKAYATTTVEYKLLVDAKAVDGLYGIKVMVGEQQPTKQAIFSVKVLSGTPKLEIVESDVYMFSPGQVGPVNFTVQNIGGSIAKDITLKINPERTVTSTGVVVEREIVSLGAAAKYIASLDHNEKATVNLTLAVNQGTALKNYSVPVTLEYFDQNGTAKTQTAYLGIKVTADAQVDAVINSVNPKAFPGGTSEIVIDMFNVGLADAKYVVVEISGEHASIEEPKQFIGTLEADDFDSFKTNVSFDPATPLGELPMTLKVYYKNDDLEEQVTTKQLSVNILSPGAATDMTGGALMIFIGLISLALELIGLYVVARWAYPRAKVLVGKARKKK